MICIDTNCMMSVHELIQLILTTLLKCWCSNYSFFTGEWIYKLFMHQACVFENKSQYVKSHSTLTEVIAKMYADGFITQELKEAIETYQVKSQAKNISLQIIFGGQ